MESLAESVTVPNCDPRCASSLGIKPGTGKSKECHNCRLEARGSAAPSRAISIQPGGKKKRAMTNYR